MLHTVMSHGSHGQVVHLTLAMGMVVHSAHMACAIDRQPAFLFGTLEWPGGKAHTATLQLARFCHIQILILISYSSSATREEGAVAALAEERKTAKYTHLNPTHAFTPVAIETSGVFGPQTMAFLKELGQRLAQASGDERSTTYLFQRLSVAVQRGNSASVLGTTGQLPGQDFLFRLAD